MLLKWNASLPKTFSLFFYWSCIIIMYAMLLTWQRLPYVISIQGLPVPTVGTSMAVTITHVFLWGSRATNHIGNARMGSPCINQILLQLKWPSACLWVLERFLTIYSREIRPGAVSYTIEAHSNDLFTIEHRLTSKIWAQHTERSYVSDINFI